MVDIVDKCRVWESHAELRGRPEMECEPGTSRGVFHVREQVMNDKKEETAAEPDSNYSKLGNLTDRLRELVKQPSPAGSRPVDIGQLLRQLLPIEDEANEIGQPCQERNPLTIVCRETRSDPGRGLVTRISPDKEPQRDDFRNFYEEPDIRVNSALIMSLGSRWPNSVESDDSEDDDVLPQEEYWALPDDGWTLVENPQVKSRGVRFKTNISNDARDGGILEERNYYDALEDFVDDSDLLNYKRKEIRNTNVRVEASYERREVTVDVPLPMYVQLDRLTLSPRDDVTPIVSDEPDRLIGLPTVDTDGVNVAQDNKEQTLYNSESDSVTIMEQGMELWPVPSEVGQCIIKEEVITDESPAEQGFITETTKPMVSIQLVKLSQECWTKGVLQLAEEAKLVVTSSVTFGGIEGDVQRSPEVTMPAVQTDLRNLPCKRIAGAFLRLAEEALLVDVGLTTVDGMEEIGPQRCGFGEAISKDISWRREDIVDRSVDFVLKEAMRMPTSVVEEDRSLQWSIEECTDEVRVHMRGSRRCLPMVLWCAKLSWCSWQPSLKCLPQFLWGSP